MQVTFRPDGTAEYIHDGGLVSDLGDASKRRASRIEPCDLVLRLAFTAIRAVSADESRLAAWTRSWGCLWRVRVLGGPTFGLFTQRQAAIEAEVMWLEENRL